jgi:hypothetical protein
MKKLAIALLCVFSLSSFGAMMVPDDYEQSNRFFKVEKESSNYRKSMYKFYECTGDVKNHSCDSIFSPIGYSKAELNSLETKEATYGTLVLAAEIVTGGIIWKRLMKFTLGGAVRITRNVTGYTEGVANGSIALAVTAPANAGATYLILNQANRALDIVDPFSRFRRSELIDTDEYDQVRNGVIALSYDYQEAYNILAEMLATVQ